MVYQSSTKQYADRRLGRDLKRISQDINIYRWFAVFIKCALELEGKEFSIRNKIHKVRFNRNHKWWKLIDLNLFPRTPKFIRFDNNKLPTQQRKLFDEYFFPRYRHLFIEKSTIIGSAHKVPYDYTSMHFPPNYPIKSILSDVRKFYKDKEVKLKKGRKKISEVKDSKHNADIVLGNGSEELMRRLFHTLSIQQSSTNKTSLDVFFDVKKRMNKKYPIPIIERLNKSGLVIGAKTRTTRQDFESEIRSTMRDMRLVKTLLINLCKGIFPKTDKVI